MPSGAKKRKAAKKKKETQSSNHNNQQPPHSHGDHDVKNQSQEDKDSDISDVGSSASQDHYSQHSSSISENEGEEIEKKESQIEGIQDIKSDVQQSSVQVEREFMIEDESSTKNGTFKHDDESARRSYDVGQSGSSCASSDCNSDDESRNIEINTSDSLSQKPVETVQSPPIQKTSDDLNVGNSRVLVSKKVPSLREEVDIESENSVVAPQCSGEDKLDSSMASTEKMEEESAEKSSTMSDEKEHIAQESDEKLIVSYDATKASDDDDVVVVASEQDSGVTKPNLCARPHPVQNTLGRVAVDCLNSLQGLAAKLRKLQCTLQRV